VLFAVNEQDVDHHIPDGFVLEHFVAGTRPNYVLNKRVK
jgi:hypothetical protein